MKAVRTCFAVLALAATAVSLAREADVVVLEIETKKPGAQISRQLFGQFAEHLGRGIYEGVWVGPDSPIPNTRGIRNDVVAALKELRVPNVRQSSALPR
jgi:alpha-N-arabinofuranosidase